MDDVHYWLGFNLVAGIGSAKLQAMLRRFGDVKTAWTADVTELERLGFDRRTIANFLEVRGTVDLPKELDRVRQAGIKIVHWDSKDYPAPLKVVPVTPAVLFMQGEWLESDRTSVAIVGTRRITAYGRQMAREITAELVQHGCTIVSGLAKGVDTVAHQTALEMGGRTVAALACGLDTIYPPENRNMAKQIVAGQGALLSEYTLGVKPERKNFPPRNRIISGLALATVIIEAGEPSGALITARFAQEQRKAVFAVPGNVTSNSSVGTNNLIKRGEAKLVTCAADVLAELDMKNVKARRAMQMALPSSAEEAQVLKVLGKEAIHVDEVIRGTGLEAAVVTSTVTLLELKGLVQQVGGMNYVRI